MFSMRGTLVLCALVLLLAAWTCWSVAAAGMIPSFWISNPALAPHFIAGFAIALAAIGAPLIFSRDELKGDAAGTHLLKSAQASLWLAIAAAFMMLTASRVSPVSAEGIAYAALWIFFTAWFAIVLNRMAPRAANALLFLWIIALPVAAYMLAEVFLTSPAGGTGLADSAAPQAAALRAVVRWTLNDSPGTGALGGLTNSLADGSTYSFTISAFTMLVLVAVITAMIFRNEKIRTRTPGATEQYPAPC